jgi:hypothetical protein
MSIRKFLAWLIAAIKRIVAPPSPPPSENDAGAVPWAIPWSIGASPPPPEPHKFYVPIVTK